VETVCADIGADPDHSLHAYCIEANPLWSVAVHAGERMNLVAPLDNELVEAVLEGFREAWTG
jgi:hypothetical protein